MTNSVGGNEAFLSLFILRYWQAGQPNSHGGNQDCGEVLETSSGVGEWNDDACSGEQTYICEL